MKLPDGKLEPDLLGDLIRYTSDHPDVLVGPSVGEDAAVVRGEDRIIVTADPITFTEEDIGTYVIAVNCNDIVAMGGIPRYFTTTILLPTGTRSEDLEDVFARISEAATAADVLWVGGHTEVTSAVNRIVVSGGGVGMLHRQPTTTASARPGQLVVLTKWVALEGTTLVARERDEECRRALGTQYDTVLRWLYDPGIAIVAEGRVLADRMIAAAHDPTEGGLATGVQEIAARSGVGMVLKQEAIPIRDETRTICDLFGLDPLGMLSSGCYLFTAEPSEARVCTDLLHSSGIGAAIIGETTDEPGRVVMRGPRGTVDVPTFTRDECLKIL